MRADRLVATLLILQARGRVTAAELAGELEVSVATARRDLDALSTAGIPVYPQPGRGGGWQLLGGARTDLTGLTASEARALFLLVGPATSGTPDARSALRKLLRALPSTFRAEAEVAADAVVVDPARWGASGATRPALVDTLEAAVVGRRAVRMRYRSRGNPPTPRQVEPLGLVDKDGAWYLVATTDAGRRTFRIDRMSDVEVTDEPAERPAGFALAAAWDEVVETVEQGRGGVTATVVAREPYARVLRGQFGRQAVTVGAVDDDRVRLRLSSRTAGMIAERIAGWGALIDVEGPPEVRAELARIVAELIERHGPA